MPKKAEKPTPELTTVGSADPFESTVDALAPRKMATAPRKPRAAKSAAKATKPEAAFAKTADEPVKQAR